ncbi:hypothetical protein CYLTODRAFT_460100 [Cylindrobasidium torrendii FP15055 ss-10]|uniref:Uncharacterized protein n=1 Tax=Cylindrobasidium torrendii FP15055 ss-10 TaxID=1314674 RepID=A0A0D7AS08_9AGAR|nr:hypothetical protein CYLTODRAFT_460100 [Cylindrobasidium torrendii FP15055 ss-10]
MLRSYVTVQLRRNPRSGDYFAWDVNKAIVCLLADVPVCLEGQRVESADCLEKAFSDAVEPLSLPVCAWQQLYVANKRDKKIFKFLLHGEDAAVQIYTEIYTKAKDSLDADNTQKVILNTLLCLDGTKVSPFAVLTPRAFLLRAGIDVFDALHIGPEKQWVYTDRDHELEAPMRFLLDMNQYFVITLGAESASKLNEGHLEGLWQMIMVLAKHTSNVEGHAVCAALHKTLEMIIDTEGPEEGLQLYPRFAGALHEMLEVYTLVEGDLYKPLSPTTSLLLRIAARRDRYHTFLSIGFWNDDPEAYELFMNASSQAPASQDEDDIASFVDDFARGVARSTSPYAVETWKDEAARKRCAEWFFDRERFASLVRQAGRWAENWKEYVLDRWHPRPNAWYYEEVKRAVSEWAADERREGERQARIAADNVTQPAPVIEEQNDKPGHESAPPSHSGGPADSSQVALVVDGQSAGFEYYFRRVRDFFGLRRSGTGDAGSAHELHQV